MEYPGENFEQEGRRRRLVRAKSGGIKIRKIHPAEKESGERNIDAGIVIERD